ncbi:MAG: hydantoinase/oxoprolinase family protein [Candidatus Aerophobetes bacterium]|nr:hydantoinase/oxoprolinase family protein [Candidatus Aerophobetes bacterium]
MSKDLAIDVGGTFTDFVLVDMETEETVYEKSPSNPKNPVASIAEGIRKLKVDLKDVRRITYATTIGTNTLIERKGAKCGLITTKGFRDVYDIGRMSKKEMYNEFYEKHKVLIPRRRRLELNERINAKGEIVKKIDREETLDVARKLVEDGVESIAVCLLHSYAKPTHEKIVEKVIKEYFPEVSVSLSHEIANEYREFERTSTTVINAYITPPLEKHISEINSFLKKQDFKGNFLIMQANGSCVTYEEATEKSICMLDSGPCTGVAGYAKKCKSRNIEHLITGDVGGTSFDVGVVVEGRATIRTSSEILKHPILMPSIDVHTIGAGGGSIAWIDAGGALNVGPASAGADPGPACYGKGGENPTVTDADVVIGLIDPDFFCGGEIKIYSELAAEAIRKKIAAPLNEEVIESAIHIFRIINAKMAYAIRTVTIEKGLDPTEFILCCYGGAGPVHASSIAGELGIRKIIIPRGCANLCAKELIGTDIRHDFTKSLPPATQLFDENRWNTINSSFENLLEEGEDTLEHEGIPPEERLFVKSFDLRYVGQEYTFNIIDSSERLSAESIRTLKDKFNSVHEREYGFFLNDPIEVVDLRVAAIGKVPKVEVKFPLRGGDAEDAVKGERNVAISSEVIEYTVFDRVKLPVGSEVRGPSIIEEKTSNTVVLPDDIARVNEFGEIVIEKNYK